MLGFSFSWSHDDPRKRYVPPEDNSGGWSTEPFTNLTALIKKFNEFFNRILWTCVTPLPLAIPGSFLLPNRRPLMQTVWVLQQFKSRYFEITQPYYLAKVTQRLRPIYTQDLSHALVFESEAQANAQLTFDLKHEGWAARQVSIPNSKMH